MPGCFTSTHVAKALEPGAADEAGLVFGTIGSSGEDSPTTLRQVNYRLIGMGTTDPFDGEYRGTFAYANSGGGFSAFATLMFRTPDDVVEGDARATLFSARLVPGEYEIYATIFTSSPAGGWATHGYYVDVEPIRFRVAADGTTYLGEFLSYLSMRRDQDGVPVSAGGCFKVSDKLARDLVLLNRKRDEPVAAEAVVNAAADFATNGDCLALKSLSQ
jgi:hypothetical protein